MEQSVPQAGGQDTLPAHDNINDHWRICFRRFIIGVETLQPLRWRKTKSSEKEKRAARQSVFLKSRLFRIEYGKLKIEDEGLGLQ